MCVCVCVCMYVRVKRERERGRERDHSLARAAPASKATDEREWSTRSGELGEKGERQRKKDSAPLRKRAAFPPFSGFLKR